MTALTESFLSMSIHNIFSWPISTFLHFSQIGKPVLDSPPLQIRRYRALQPGQLSTGSSRGCVFTHGQLSAVSSRGHVLTPEQLSVGSSPGLVPNVLYSPSLC